MRESVLSRPAARIALLVLFAALAGGLGVAAYFLHIHRSQPDVTVALERLRSASTFTYVADISADITRGADERFTFSARSHGSVKNSPKGIGDGAHTLNVSLLNADASSTRVFTWFGDARIIGEDLYLYATSTPVFGKIDPSILVKYWIVVPIRDILREISGKDVAQVIEANDGIISVLVRERPLSVSGAVVEGMLPDDTPVSIVPLAVNSQHGIEFLREIFSWYVGSALELSDEERIRLEQAIAKITGEAYIDRDGNLRRIVFSYAASDVWIKTPISGKVSLSFEFSSYNAPVEVIRPTQTLTIGELEAEMKRYQAYTNMRARDAARLETLFLTQAALERFRIAKDRYPAALSEIFGDPAFTPPNASSTIVSELLYHGYLSPETFTKSNRCTFKEKSCPAYHLAVELENPSEPALATAEGRTGEILGGPSIGCAGTPGRACFDRTQASAPVIESAASTTEATSTASSSSSEH
jgi:hypothetical protein